MRHPPSSTAVVRLHVPRPPRQSGLEFRVLGPVEVRRDGLPLPVLGATTLILLAGLLLEPNQVVHADMLIEWRWGGRLPAHPRAALQSGISRLRGLLGEDLLETAGFGYRLNTGPDQLDLLRFRELTRTAERAAALGASADALAALDGAAALWRGTPLSNIDSPVLQQAIPQLAEDYLRVIEQRGDLALALGRHAELIHQLPAALRDHPFHERLAGQLMIALARSGRRVEALTVYERLRRTLDAELGIAPGAAVQRLRDRIRRGDPDLGPAAGPGGDGPPRHGSGVTAAGDNLARLLPR
jgi:DNA-binding SARP family transcriptional activator